MPPRPRPAEGEGEAGRRTECPARVPNCETGIPVMAGSKLCAVCCTAHLVAQGDQSRIRSEAADLLRAADKEHYGIVVLKKSGEPVTDWTTVKSEAKFDAGTALMGEMLPTESTCTELMRSEKYPTEQRTGSGRTYANALVVHVYSAHVAFVQRAKRKPKGEELNKLLHGAWCMYLAASESEEPEEEGDEDLADGVLYAMKYGDAVSYEKTNTYDMKGFVNATNHGRLVKEVEKARELLIKFEKEAELTTKWGMVHKDQLELGSAQIPENEVYIDFRIAKLGKKECILWSTKLWPHARPAKGGGTKGKGKGGRGTVPPAAVSKAICIKTTREQWEDMIQRYDNCHSTSPNPPVFTDDDEEAAEAEVEGENAATKRKRVGVTTWAKAMIALNDIEMHILMAIGEGRHNSQDPKANLHAKQEEIRKAQVEKAKAVAEAAAEVRRKKEESESRAKEMQDKAALAWESRATTQHAALENDDAKVYGLRKAQQTMRRIEKAITPKAISKDQPIPTMAEFLATYALDELSSLMAEDEWDLRTLLNSYDQPTFEKDFESLKPAKRRKLQNSLRDAMDALQPPPTPSPEKPPPREKPAVSPAHYGRGGGG